MKGEDNGNDHNTCISDKEIKMRVDEYITEKEKQEFCANCNEICSRHCAIRRKAEERYNEAEKAEKPERRS